MVTGVDASAGTPIAQVIGGNARRIRVEVLRTTQVAVADACVRVGLGWGFRRVAQLEAGQVAASLPTLFLLAAALDSLTTPPMAVTVVDLIAHDGRVHLAPGTEVPGPTLVGVLRGGRAQNLLPFASPFEDPGTDARVRERARVDYGRADARVARELGIGQDAMVAATAALWGQGLEVERNHRAAETGTTSRVGLARITAALRDELRSHLGRCGVHSASCGENSADLLE
jgi:hypothetical protein